MSRMAITDAVVHKATLGRYKKIIDDWRSLTDDYLNIVKVLKAVS